MSSEQVKDGGPAFPPPAPIPGQNRPDLLVHHPGMSLRDYFAGQVLEGLCANGSPVVLNGETVSHDVAAYRIADGMLKTRELKDPKPNALDLDKEETSRRKSVVQQCAKEIADHVHWKAPEQIDAAVAESLWEMIQALCVDPDSVRLGMQQISREVHNTPKDYVDEAVIASRLNVVLEGETSQASTTSENEGGEGS